MYCLLLEYVSSVLLVMFNIKMMRHLITERQQTNGLRVCAFVSEAAVQRGREEQGNHTGSLLHGILYHFQTIMKRHLFS